MDVREHSDIISPGDVLSGAYGLSYDHPLTDEGRVGLNIEHLDNHSPGVYYETGVVAIVGVGFGLPNYHPLDYRARDDLTRSTLEVYP